MFVLAMSAAFAADPVPAPAPAAPATTAPAATAIPTFEVLDLNKDLGVDKTEAAKHAKLTTDFAAADANKDGKLSKDEYKAWSDKQAAAPAK